MIEKYEIGHYMRIGGIDYDQDLKIIDRQVTADWWRREGHRLSESDLTDILEARPDIVVIGTGYAGNMHVPEATRSILAEYGIQTVIRKTPEAVEAFNRLLKEGHHVAGAFHLTC